jgi:hypothetical protein
MKIFLASQYFILYFISGVFVWVGKKASKQERAEDMTNGQSFAKKKEYPVNTNVVRVIDGGEPAEFKALFRDWKNRDQTVGLGNRNSSKTALYNTMYIQHFINVLNFQLAILPRQRKSSLMFLLFTITQSQLPKRVWWTMDPALRRSTVS